VLPVAQWGANDVMPPYAKQNKLRLWPRKTLKVIAGPPIDLSAYYDLEPTAENLRIVTDVIMNSIADLLAELRGEPAPAERYDPRQARAQVAAKTKAQCTQEHERAGARQEAGVTHATHLTDTTDVTDATEESEA
jgi:hypothetical protein